MYNPKHLKKLDEGIAEWNAWRQREPHTIPDLSGAPLENRVISALDASSLLVPLPAQGYNFRNVNFDGANLNGSVIDQADLRGATMNGTQCVNTTFLRSDFSSAIMCKANLSGANLHGSILNKAYLRSAVLDDAQMACAKIENAVLNGASLRNSDLLSANLQGSSVVGADFTNARLQQANFRDVNTTAIKYSRNSRQSNFLGIRVGECYGDQLFKTFAQDQDYIENFRATTHRVWFWLWYISADCGRSFFRWALWSIAFVALFWLLYSLMLLPQYGLVDPDPKNAHFVSTNGLPLNPLTTLYFSVVVFTTLGFGDIAPKTNSGALVVMLQVIIGYIMLGGLIAILANKLARRS